MPQPNILLITTDQHNAEILGCAGNPLVRTPYIDRLAERGIMFDSAFTPHPVCTPARTSLFTGQYAVRHGVPYNINLRSDVPPPKRHTGLRAEATPFPEILADNGYRTAFFGKLHAKQAGTKQLGLQFTRLAEGKGQFIEYGSPPDDYRQYLRAKGYADQAWRTWELPGYAEKGHVTSPLPEQDYIDTWTATEAVEYLRQAEEPFFAWVSFSNPHTPWDPPEPYASMYSPEQIPFPARRRGELEEKHPRWVDNLARTIPATPPTSTDPDAEVGIERAYARFSDDQVRAMLAAYYGEITHIDTQVGRILAALEARGPIDSTLIVFTADHGDYCGNNWAFFKYGALYDSLARVPFIVRWPGHAEAGLRCDELVSLVDLAPTFLEAAGLEPVDPVDGRPLQPLFAGGEAGFRDDLVLDAGNIRALLDSRWKYIRWNDGFEELYDRQHDLYDLHNLALRPDYKATCSEMASRLASYEGVCY